jgi:hypothetical protein
VPHITNYQRGYEHLFPCAKGIYFVRSPVKALDVLDMLLSLPRERLMEICTRGVDHARDNSNATKAYNDIVAAIRQQLFGQ